MASETVREAVRAPEVYTVVELPESEQGAECPIWVGEPLERCNNPVEYVFVYEASLDEGDDRRKNCLACEACAHGSEAVVEGDDGE